MTDRQRTQFELTRRRFLQAALASGSAVALDRSFLLGSPLAAAPLGPTDRVVVLVELDGGNDGLNTLIPYEDGRYFDLRRAAGVAIVGHEVLPVGEGLGLHPSLTYLKSRFDLGEVAVVRGFGHPENSRSHFAGTEMMATGKASGATGWAGRWLDDLDEFEIAGVSITEGPPPLLLRGEQASCTNLPTSSSGLFGSDRTDPSDDHLYECIHQMSLESAGTGAFGRTVALATADALDAAVALNPVFANAAAEVGFPRNLAIAARVINLDIGARFLHTRLSGFDSHSSQVGPHAALLRALDDALRAFFDALDPAKHDRVVVLTSSEFGRRAAANGSSGTDHGGASVQFVVGSQVRGGFHGEQPSLGALDELGDLRVSVDSRAVFATVVNRWLGGDDRKVFGAEHPQLDLFRVAAPAPRPPVVARPPIYQSITPFRVLDTRLGKGAAVLGFSSTPIRMPIAGRGTIPATGAGAVLLNLTVTEQVRPGFLVVWPGPTMPDIAHVYFGTGRTAPNLSVLKLDDDGVLNVRVFGGPANVAADVLGWIPNDHPYSPVFPRTVLDTRRGLGASGALAAPTVLRVPVTGAAGVPNAGVGAVVVNLTVVEATAPGALRARPAGQQEAGTSTVEFVDAQPTSNLVVLAPGDGGAIEIEPSAGAVHVIADVHGWFPTDSGYRAVTAQRLVDTKSRLGAPGVFGHQAVLDVAMPDDVAPGGAVALSITAVDPSTRSYLTVWPSGEPRPATSNLTFAAGQTVTNTVVCGTGVGRSVSIFNAHGTTHLSVEVVGRFT